MGNEILAQLSLCIPAECHQSEHQPGCNVLRGQQQTGQINFHKKLAKTLIFNTHYNEEDDKTLEKKQKQQDSSHCLITFPKCKKLSGAWIITANSEYPQHKCSTCQKGYIPIVYAPQESTGVQNVSVIILPVLKTIFPHQAEFSQ